MCLKRVLLCLAVLKGPVPILCEPTIDYWTGLFLLVYYRDWSTLLSTKKFLGGKPWVVIGAIY